MKRALLKTPRFRRPATVQGPDRRAGELFRMTGAGTGIAGIPVDSAEAAAIAAVRAGYRVAEAQIDRLRNIGDRARHVGAQVAGDEAERQAVDQAEKLVSKSLLAGLSWLEGVAAEPGSPWHRFAAAQYRLLGGALGLESGPAPSAPEPRQPLAERGPRAASPRPAQSRAPSIVHGGKARRRVLVRGFEIEAPARSRAFESISFFHATELDADAITGHFRPGPGGPALHVEIEKNSPPGRWSAVLCDEANRQVGWIEIEI